MKKRELLTAAASRHLNRRGLTDNMFAEIAADIGMKREGLYYYFDDREDLVFQCYVHSCAFLRDALDAAGGRQRGDAAETIDRFIDLVLAEDAQPIATLSELALLSPPRRAEIHRLFGDFLSALADLLRLGQAKGALRPFDAGIVSAAIVGMIFRIPTQWSADLPDVPRVQLITFVKQLVRVGFARRRAATPRSAMVDLSPLTVKVDEAFDRRILQLAKKEKILATASRLFNARGVDSTTLEDIADELGATPRAIYHHVGGKPTLVAQCYLRSVRMSLYAFNEAVATAPDAVEAMCSFQRSWAIAQLREDIAPFRLFGGFASLPKAALRKMSRASREFVDRARESIQAGIASKSIRELDIDSMLFILPGASSWLAKGLSPDGHPHDEIALEIANFVAMGTSALDT